MVSRSGVLVGIGRSRRGLVIWSGCNGRGGRVRHAAATSRRLVVTGVVLVGHGGIHGDPVLQVDSSVKKLEN